MLPQRSLLCAAAATAISIAGPAAAPTVETNFDADNFDNPLVIDNPYFPLEVGSVATYKAETEDGCEWSIVTVSEDTKDITIDGETLTVRVVEDFEYEDEECDGPDPDELVEQTFDWYGQDDAGNVWYFGEDTRNCEGAGNCTPGSGAWEAGVDGALPGIIMLADPQSGDRYRQEFAEGVAEDWAKVMNLNAHPELRLEDALPPGEWDNCLVTKEWNDLESGSIEQKTYCPDAGGLVLVEEHSGKLVRFERVTNVSDALKFRAVR